MNINIKKAIATTAVIAATVVGATGCANHNADNSKANGKPSQTSTEQSQKDTPTPAPQRTTPAPSQSGADNKGNNNDNGAKTNNDGATFTQTLTADEARALDEQGLRGGVIGRENGLTVTRDGNTLTFTVDKDSTSSTGTVVTASDAKKAEADAKKADADKAAAETPGNNGNGILNPPNGGLTPPNGNGGTVVVPIVTPGGGDENPGNGTPGNNNPGVVAPFTPSPGPAPAPNPIPGGNNQDPAPAPAPAPAPEPSHADEANSFMQTFRAKYLGLINKARADLGLKPLVPSEQLTNSAQTWASYSADEGIADANYRDWKAGENHGSDLGGVTQYKNEAVSDTTATGGGYIGDDNNTADAIANRVFNQAINQDPEKRQVLLDANVDRVGIGVAEEIVTSRLDADGNVVRTGRKDQAIKTVVQTGSSTNASQVGADDKVTEYKSDGTQTMNSAKNDEFDNSLPKVKGKAPETETPASNAAPSATETTTPSEVAPAPAPAEAAGPSTEAAPVTVVVPEAGPATAAVDEAPAPESNLAPAEAPVEAPVSQAEPVTQAEPVHTESAAPVSQAAPVEASAVEPAAPVVQAAPVIEQHAPVAASTNNDTVATQAVAATPDSGVVLGVGE